jgi:ketosteroid isomerase-like protein
MTDDRGAVEQTARDYFEGWFNGDVERMDRALHPDLVKRWPGEDGAAALPVTTKARMLELTAQHAGAEDIGDGRLEITVTDLHGDIASAIVRGGIYHEYLQLVRTGDGWRIANALWAFE